MSIDLLPALVAFAFVSSITPGPNNLMLMASGVNFGFRRTIPHILGVSIGHSVMVTLVGIGLIGLFDAYPISYTILKTLSVSYLIWLAIKIARAGAPGQGKSSSDPMTFLQAAAFQWVNPKAWFMAITAISAYAPQDRMSAVLLVALVFSATNLPSVSVWAIIGQNIRKSLTNQTHLHIFNLIMAVLLIATIFPVIFE